MTKIKFSKNVFVTKICVAMQPRTCVRRPACQWLWYRHNEEREHRQDICRGMHATANALQHDALQHDRGGTTGICSFCLRVGSFHSQRVTVLNVSS